MIQVLVCTQIDINNSLYYGLPNTQLQRLQRIQNAAARIIFKKTKYEHVTPLLHELHWLPVSYRILFKLLVLIFKCLHGDAPSYLSDLISLKPISTFGLRSNKMPYLLQETRSRLLTGGDRSLPSVNIFGGSSIFAGIVFCRKFCSVMYMWRYLSKACPWENIAVHTNQICRKENTPLTFLVRIEIKKSIKTMRSMIILARNSSWKIHHLSQFLGHCIFMTGQPSSINGVGMDKPLKSPHTMVFEEDWISVLCRWSVISRDMGGGGGGGGSMSP